MNIRELTSHVPDDGGTTIEAAAKSLDAEVDEVKKMAKILECHWLVKVEDNCIKATETLISERKKGLIPKYVRCSVGDSDEDVAKDEPPKQELICSISELTPELEGVLDYMGMFWNGKLSDLRRQFRMSAKELDIALTKLSGMDLVEVTEDKKWGITRRRFNVKQGVVVGGRYATGSEEFCGAKVYRTRVDAVVEISAAVQSIPLKKLAQFFGTTPAKLVWVSEVLHEGGFIKMIHKGEGSALCGVGKTPKVYEPKNIPGQEWIFYDIKKDGVSLSVKVTHRLGEYSYIMSQPVFSDATKYLLERIYELSKPPDTNCQKNGGEFEVVGEGLRKDIRERVDCLLPFVEPSVRDVMVCELTNELNLGRLEYLLKDPYIEEIKAQSGQPVFIKQMNCPQEWVPTNIRVADEMLHRYAKSIARQTKQQIDSAHPMMDAVLHTKDRVNVSMPETAGGSVVIEIRVFSKKPWNFVRLIKRGTVTSEVMAFLWLAVQNRLNILVSGETGCGKTSFVNALGLFLPRNDHIVSVEDTREIQLPCGFQNWSHLTTRNGSCENEVTMSQLLVNALRMDPSFIIMGEVRNKNDIQTLMGATVMGHPVISTIHTRDCSTTIKRFEDAQISAQDLVNINLNVILEAVRQKDDPRSSVRVVKEVGEYQLAGQQVDVNRIYKMNMSTRVLEMVNEPRNCIQQIMGRTGLESHELVDDLRDKREVLDWLVRKDVEDINDLSRIIQLYYHDPKKVAGAARDDMELREIIYDEGVAESACAESQ